MIIQTKYNGYYFRSRTEARWAVFFDSINWKYEYEKEGFILSNGKKYLPDFYFPDINTWVEVKGEDFTKDELEKCMLLVKETKQNCLLLVGAPDLKQYCLLIYENEIIETEIMFVPKDEKYYPFFFTGGEFNEYLAEQLNYSISKARSERF